MRDTIAITGGFGFIGSNFVHMLADIGYDGDIVIESWRLLLHHTAKGGILTT